MRENIEKYLDAVSEASAKVIANRIGLPQEDVVKEMHRMHADGVVERGKRKGGGNEYVYWLARRNAAPPAEAGAIAVPAVSGPNVEPIRSEGEAPPFPRMGQMRELLGILGLPSTMPEAIDAARGIAEAAKAAMCECDALRLRCDELNAENEANKQSGVKWRQNCADLEARIDELTIGPVGSKAPLFVTIGRYAKPQRHDSLERAQKRGRRLVRGDKESEVLVLEPVGRIVRGTEWLPQR